MYARTVTLQVVMDRRPSNGHSDGPKFTLDDVELDDPGIHSAVFERQGLASGAGPRSDAVRIAGIAIVAEE